MMGEPFLPVGENGFTCSLVGFRLTRLFLDNLQEINVHV